MFQKEFAERLVAQPGSKHYCRLSVMAQLFAKISCVCKVSRGSFHPQPEVDSMVVAIRPRRKQAAAGEAEQAHVADDAAAIDIDDEDDDFCSVAPNQPLSLSLQSILDTPALFDDFDGLLRTCFVRRHRTLRKQIVGTKCKQQRLMRFFLFFS
jgi:16S rRNA A1518/A1519 N6-dimethyltransferase RsmA/KsgA/DIM1 with predicted DNA glycosylase/AP lyase activity